MEKLIRPKPFEELTCSDNFMFAKVMEDPELCKSVLEILLGIKIGKLSYPEPEKTIQTAPDAKGIRLDVHTQDGKHEFDIEMQTTLYKDLRKRSRYYQSLMDVDFLLKGNTYSKLKENIVIFICLGDLFKQGLPVYTFENICRENNSVKLEDRTLKVFYNCSSWQNVASKEQAEFLKFLLTDKAESSLCKKLKEREKKIKMTARAQKEYMDYCMITQGYYNSGKEDGYKQGVEDGEARGEERAKLEAARNLINLGVSLDIIAQAQALPLEKVREIAESLKQQE
ncbi:MAG: Rpn family recombination-promoting nuclease/putative transposase [Spirochaetaceae bacterium]|nr:Rpn family recombination-promoting nuclease/putative transposase [Spirochaetaceae bacterium]